MPLRGSMTEEGGFQSGFTLFGVNLKIKPITVKTDGQCPIEQFWSIT